MKILPGTGFARFTTHKAAVEFAAKRVKDGHACHIHQTANGWYQVTNARYAQGNWQVERNCCQSGLCITCRGNSQRPMRIVHADGYSEQYAKFVASNWHSYKAEAKETANANIPSD